MSKAVQNTQAAVCRLTAVSCNEPGQQLHLQKPAGISPHKPEPGDIHLMTGLL
mgnify:CR=1 FL=1